MFVVTFTPVSFENQIKIEMENVYKILKEKRMRRVHRRLVKLIDNGYFVRPLFDNNEGPYMFIFITLQNISLLFWHCWLHDNIK